MYLTVLFAFPIYAYAGLYISEIMYNPDGSDRGREWVEICNDSDIAVNVEDFLFLEEKNKEHTLTVFSGNKELLKDDCAVITDDTAKLLADFPNINSVFKTSGSISLVNYGEKLGLKDSQGVEVDSADYSPLKETDNTGDSLQKINGIWKGAKPTPGEINAGQNSKSKSGSSSGSASNISDLSISDFNLAVIKPPEDVFIRLKNEVNLYTGEYLDESVEVFDSTGAGVDKFDVAVSFGDISAMQFSKDLRHKYKYPGTYILNAKVKKDIFEDSANMKVVVESNPLRLNPKDEVIEIINEGERDMNIEDWILRCGFETYKFQTLYVPGKEKLIVNKKDIFRYCPENKTAYIILKDIGTGIVAKKFQEQPVSEPETQKVVEEKTLKEQDEKVVEKLDVQRGLIGYDVPKVSPKVNTKSKVESVNSQNASVLLSAGEGNNIYKHTFFFLLLFVSSAIVLLFIFKDPVDDWDFEES